MQKSMKIFSFFCCWVGILLFGKFGPEHKNCDFKLKFGTYTNSGMHNSVVMFILFVFDWKYRFSENLVQKIKIVTLCRNLVPTLILPCRIELCHSRFLFLNGNTIFGQNWSENIKIVTLCRNLVPTLILPCRIELCHSRFLFLSGNTIFGQNWSKSIKIVTLCWNLVPTLILACRIQ